VADPEYWIAHKFLAAVYLKEHKFEKSRAQCEIAIAKSKGAGASIEKASVLQGAQFQSLHAFLD